MLKCTFIFHTDRQTEGIAQGHAHQGKVPSIPDYTTISRRINKLNVKIKDTDSKNKEFEDEYMVIAIDSIGIKVTNRGQWLRDKWKVRKKGYLKIHISINAKSKKILSLNISDEHVRDSKALSELMDDVIKSNSITSAVGKLFADRAHDGNDIFRYLTDNGSYPVLK